MPVPAIEFGDVSLRYRLPAERGVKTPKEWVIRRITRGLTYHDLCALLGRSRAEMQARLDEIVGFAELEGFIDSPIRTYSTGMLARLAFAIATTVEAQILLLDEVMAVGDERFRRKCQEHIDSFRSAGVTILIFEAVPGALPVGEPTPVP